MHRIIDRPKLTIYSVAFRIKLTKAFFIQFIHPSLSPAQVSECNLYANTMIVFYSNLQRHRCWFIVQTYFMERCPWSKKSTSASNIINSIKSVCAKTNKSKQKKCALVFFIVDRSVLCSRWYFCGAMLKETTIWRRKQLAHWTHIMHNK